MKEQLALFILRVFVGLSMMFGHGIPKLVHFAEKHAEFPDPLGVGGTVSMALAIFAEVFCSAALVAGVVTRWAAVPLAFTMIVALAFVHAQDPWAKKELAAMYLVSFIVIAFLGPGQYSLDSWKLKKRV